MKRIFGGQKTKAPPPTLADASGNLKSHSETLDNKIRTLDEQLLKARQVINRTRPGPTQEAAKRRALMILKHKRLYEGQRDQLHNQQFNLDQVAFHTESVNDTVTTVQAMEGARKELKTAMKQKELDIDQIESMQDDMADVLDKQNEINDALGRTYNVPDEVDECEFLDELAALEADIALESDANTVVGVPSYLQETPELPAAPVGGALAAVPQHVEEDAHALPRIPQRN